MFSLSESVKGGTRKSSSGTLWLKWLEHVSSLTTHSLRDLGHSHLKTLCASVSLSVTGGYALPPRGVVRLAADQPSTGRNIRTTRTAAGRGMDWFVFQNRSQPCWYCEEQKSKRWVFREGLES